MSVLRGILCAIGLLASLSNMTGEAHGARIGEMAAMQAAMQRHIDRRLVNGAFLHLDMKSGEVRLLYPAKAHTTILSMGDYFVLCSDFRDSIGVSVNVDFYLARQDENFVVFHSVVDDRDVLQQWLREGKAKRFD